MHSLEFSPLALDVLPCWNLAAHAASLGPVRTIHRRPAAEGEFPGQPPREVRLAIPDLNYLQTIALGDEETPVDAPREREVEDALRRVVGPMHLDLLVTVGEDEETIPISIRPPWYFAHDRASRVSAAALVVPGDDRVLETMNAVLFRPVGLASGVPPRDFLDPRLLADVPARLYRHLQEAWQIQYRDPRRETDEWSEGSCQSVRPPAEVLRGDRGPVGEGSCLDLTLFFAACLETVGIAPLLLFTGEPDQAPEHVFVGWWADAGPRFRPLLTDSDMLEEWIVKGELRVLEPTGICLPHHRLEFNEAGARARRFFAGPVHAVDVAATRPPIGDVRSLVLSNEPLVQHAIWAAQALAERSGAGTRETTHLLYGLCAVSGELTVSLLEESGGTAARLRSLMEGAPGQGTPPGASRPTRNYELCLEAARLNASLRGSGVVAEADLAWAIVENPSRNVVRILEAAGCDPTKFVERLRERAPRGGERSMSRRFTRSPGEE